MSRPRDSQRGKVYSAEWSIAPQPITKEEVNDLADRVVSSRWLMGIEPNLHGSLVKVATSRLCNATWSSTSGLRIPRSYAMRSQIATLHTVAHVIAPHDAAWHGREFCKILLEMTGRFVSKKAEDQLRDAYKEHGVKLRVVTQASRDAARERWYARKEDNLQNDLEALLKDLGS